MNKEKKYLLLAGDAVILYLSLFLTLMIRYSSDFNSYIWSRHLLPFTIIFLVWLIVFYIDDLYDLSFNQGLAGLLVKLVRGMIISVMVAAVFFYFTVDRLFTIKPQRVLLIHAIIATVILYLWRVGFSIFVRSPKRAQSILFIGYNDLTGEVITKISSTPQLGLQAKAILLSDATTLPSEFSTLLAGGDYSALKAICIEKKIGTIVSTVNPRQDATLVKSLFECLPLKIDFYDITSFYEKITGKIPVTLIEQLWFLENLTENSKNLYERFKRVVEILFAVLLFGASLPFIPFIALSIKISGPGPIFFVQKRVGKDGKVFSAIKFRTMIVGAEKNGPQWATQNDERITPIGKFMRKTRIDEIPQLINVILGDMSLIGPRPERPEFVEQLQGQIPFYKERLLVKPGLTGWAQVAGPAYGGSKEESLEKLQFDLFYIKNRSVGLDISILLKTIRTVISQKGQ
jgi:exopolysaccharide biosynthesis polyprenyl glycosylphosphotransferase